MKRYSEEERKMWLEDWKQSGKSAWAYAKENGLNQQTFINWTKTEKEISQSFIEIPTKTIQPPQYLPEILIEKGDVKIHIPLMIGRCELRAVMEGLGACL